MNFKKAYFLFYYKLCTFFNVVDPDRPDFNKWKAITIVEILELFLMTSVGLQIEILTDLKVLPDPNIDPKIWAIPIVIIITALNYNVLQNKGWGKFETEIKAYPPYKHTKINIIVLVICVSIVAFLFFSFYKDAIFHHRSL